jgi:hypothetical protein
MALPGATPADGVVDTRSDVLVRHGPVSQVRRCASGYRGVGTLFRPAVGPVAQSSMLQVNDTRHGRRTRLPPEIRVHITWDGASMLATRPPQPICSASQRRPRLHRLNRAADPLSILDDS